MNVLPATKVPARIVRWNRRCSTSHLFQASAGDLAANNNAKLVPHMSHKVELTGDVTEKGWHHDNFRHQSEDDKQVGSLPSIRQRPSARTEPQLIAASFCRGMDSGTIA
jgi:hypothetical protein